MENSYFFAIVWFFDHLSFLRTYESLIVIESENHGFGCLTTSIKPKYKAPNQQFSWGVAPRPPFFRVLQQPEALNYLLLELINVLP